MIEQYTSKRIIVYMYELIFQLDPASSHPPTSCINDVLEFLYLALDDTIALDGCPYERDFQWNITWANTARNAIDIQHCPGGINIRGDLNT